MGRKPTAFAAAALCALFTAAGLACTAYWTWLATRMLAGVGAAGVGLGAYILSTEPIGAGWRGLAGINTQIFFIVGELALVAISALRGWRAMTAAVAALNGALLLLWPFVPESGRWLQVVGRKDEAFKARGWGCGSSRGGGLERGRHQPGWAARAGRARAEAELGRCVVPRWPASLAAGTPPRRSRSRQSLRRRRSSSITRASTARGRPRSRSPTSSRAAAPTAARPRSG
jgi:MFS family permease